LEPGELGGLSMNCFKARLAPPRHFGMEFRKRHGFVSRDPRARARTVTEIVTEILTEFPDSNQTEIVRLGRAAGCKRQQIESCLKNGEWVKSRGPKNAILYSVP